MLRDKQTLVDILTAIQQILKYVQDIINITTDPTIVVTVYRTSQIKKQRIDNPQSIEYKVAQSAIAS